MSDKDAAKRRRQARNRQERINRQKRTDGARRSGTARPSRSVGSAGGAASPGKDGRPSRAANPAPASGGLLGKLFPPRPAPADPEKEGEGKSARPARVPQPRESVVLDVGDGELTGLRGEILRRLAQPGGRATCVAVVLALVVVVMVFTASIVPRFAFPAHDAGTGTEPGDGAFAEMVVRAQPGTEEERTERLAALEDRDPAEVGTQRLTDVLNPTVVVALSLLLLLVVGMAFRSLDRPTRSRTLMYSAFGLVALMFFLAALGQILLPLVAALAFASYQSRKADRLAAVQGEVG